jgi:hypothetical protein
MPIFVWVIYPYAMWSACVEMMASCSRLAPAQHDQP